MLHVLTVHWRSDAWIEPQLRYLERYAPPDARVWAVLNGIDPRWFPRFSFVADLEGTHPQKLNQLAEIVLEEARPDDHLLFLDGDAFPVAPVAPLLSDPAALLAVRRDENMGDRQPHPCFCVTTARFWRDIGGDWRRGYEWRNAAGEMVTDTGGNLLGRLLERGVAWRPLLRMNTTDLHPLWFGVYGDDTLGPVAYHHGAGFRERVSRVDSMTLGFGREVMARRRSPTWLPGARRVEKALRERLAVRRQGEWEREQRPRQEDLADEVFRSIVADEDVVARFVPDPR